MINIKPSIIKVAIEECNKSEIWPRIGAVVFKGKKIYGSGHNEIRSSSISNKHKKWFNSLHAEQAALNKLDWDSLKGCSILVMRISKSGVIGNAKPCPICSKIIDYVGIKHVYFSNEKGEISFEKR